MVKHQLTEKSYMVIENGLLHNPDGPAMVHEDGTTEWYLNGKLHNANGPARIFPDGSNELWFNGNYQGKTTPDGVFWPWATK